MTKAFVLSGGSVKGAFQAGAIKAVIESGYLPDIIYGTSVGALNGSFLTNELGKKVIANNHTTLTHQDWIDASQKLYSFWIKNITCPHDIAIKRSTLADIWSIVTNQFKGLSGTQPMSDKIDQILNINNLQKAPIVLKVGTVDFITSALHYNTPFDEHFIDYVKGSMAIPIAMPAQISSSKPPKVLFDGGTREVAPLGQALNDGATKIWAILCQPNQLDCEPDFNQGNLMNLVTRLQDTIVNQDVNQDVKTIELINKLIEESNTLGITIPSLNKYKIVDHLVIRPNKQLHIDINEFTSKDIKEKLEEGYKTAKDAIDFSNNLFSTLNSSV
jgi:NTE family protein